MIDAVLWLIGVEAIGLVAVPIAYVTLGGLKDRGLTLAKPLGILLVGYLTWILSAAHILPNARFGPQIVLILLAIVAGWIAYRKGGELLAHLRSNWKPLLTAEVVFLTVFIGWTIYRAFDPAINHTEQPMDLMFLNASMRTEFVPPEDPWLRGEAVSYYYFGFWMMGAVANLTGVISSIAYNLSLALIPAMTAMATVGLVYNLVSAAGGRLRIALASGLLAALLLSAAANLEGIFELIRANALGTERFWGWLAIDGLDGSGPQVAEGWHPNQFWWWWRASRVINTFDGGSGVDFTIQEFPFFSALLGDLHPHFLSLPFVILFLGLCANFMSARHPRQPDVRSLLSVRNKLGLAPAFRLWTNSFRPLLPSLLLVGLVLGGLGFINAWDLPVFAAIFIGLTALKAYAVRGAHMRDILVFVLPVCTLVVALAFILYLPYFGSFQSQFSGIRPVVTVNTRPIHFLIIWGLFLVAVAPMTVSAFLTTTVKPGWRRMASVALAVGFLPFVAWLGVLLWGSSGEVNVAERFFELLPLMLLISAGTYVVMSTLRGVGAASSYRHGTPLAIALSTFGLLLLLGPEILFVGDQFGNRMNTVFKFYYQAWVLLSLTGGFALYYWAKHFKILTGYKRVLSLSWASFFCALLVISLYYPVSAITSKPQQWSQPLGLDGLAHLSVGNADELEAIEFLRDISDRDAAILEAVGGSYTEFGRVSASTGIPTVLGWPGHQAQWRGSEEAFYGRYEDVQLIYQTPDLETAEKLLRSYRVDYVYIGPRERRTYGSEGMTKFDEFMDRIFSTDTVVIYRLVDNE